MRESHYIFYNAGINVKRFKNTQTHVVMSRGLTHTHANLKCTGDQAGL